MKQKNFDFKQKILDIVKKINKGKVKTYKEIAGLVGKPQSFRAIANILANNHDLKIPCHRVIKSDYTIGGYLGSFENSWQKLALLLQEGLIAVMPTDTIYGICGVAFKKEVVERIYRLRKRSPHKPMIILIADIKDLEFFGIKIGSNLYKNLKNGKFSNRFSDINKNELKILQKLWPGPISVILDIYEKNKIKKFYYLHRGTKTLAFRLPKPKWLRDILKISGPLVAPSANWEGYEPAKTISEAKKYFGDKVTYYDGRRIKGKPSTLIKLKNGKIEVLRKGVGYNLLFNF